MLKRGKPFDFLKSYMRRILEGFVMSFSTVRLMSCWVIFFFHPSVFLILSARMMGSISCSSQAMRLLISISAARQLSTRSFGTVSPRWPSALIMEGSTSKVISLFCLLQMALRELSNSWENFFSLTIFLVSKKVNNLVTIQLISLKSPISLMNFWWTLKMIRCSSLNIISMASISPVQDSQNHSKNSNSLKSTAMTLFSRKILVSLAVLVISQAISLTMFIRDSTRILSSRQCISISMKICDILMISFMALSSSAHISSSLARKSSQLQRILEIASATQPSSPSLWKGLNLTLSLPLDLYLRGQKDSKKLLMRLQMSTFELMLIQSQRQIQSRSSRGLP